MDEPGDPAGDGNGNRLSGTYAGYSIGCAVVWAVILLLGDVRFDADTNRKLRRMAGAWWTGWTSATIARAVYPAPRPLGPEAQRRLGLVSLVLVALGLVGVVRLFATGGRELD